MLDNSDMIFVFGSNKAGRHGAGAALYAYTYHNAEYGVGEGLTGSCYALPTKGYKIESIPISEVADAIALFLKTATHLDLAKFKVTQIGCGLGGFTSEQIAPFFRDAPNNCYFDEAWREYLGDDAKYWGAF